MYVIDIVRFLSSHSILLYITMAHRDYRNQIKGFVAKNNMTFVLKDGKVLVASSVINVTASRNGNICNEDVVKYKYGRKICYLIAVCDSQSEITRATCICLQQDQSAPVIPWLSYSPLDPRFTGSNLAGVD